MTVTKAQHHKQGFLVAIVVSLYNRDITKALQEGAIKRLLSLGLSKDQVVVFEVPGAVEIPLVAQKLLKTKPFDVVIALGAVIRGETSHYDYVCQLVSSGCQQVALAFDTPVIFGVLTTENEFQAWDRLGGAHGHKGVEAADAAWDMHGVLQSISAHL